MEYINFNDEKLPIDKRKEAYIKWAVSKGTKLIEAQRQANKKFVFEKKEGVLFMLYRDPEWMEDWYFYKWVYGDVDISSYKDHEFVYIKYMYDDEVEELIKEYEQKGWDIIYRTIFGTDGI